MHLLRSLSLAGVLATGLAIPMHLRPAHAQPMGYQVIDLGTLGGNFLTYGYAISHSGQYVGGYSTPAGNAVVNGFLWHNGVMEDLPPLTGYTNSQVRGVNNFGMSAGISANYNTTYQCYVGQATVWQADGTARAITIPGSPSSQATWVNDNGVVVGRFLLSNSQQYQTGPCPGRAQRAFYSLGYVGVPLSSPYGFSFAQAVNDADTIVGGAEVANGQQHAVEWPRPGMPFVDLGTFGGVQSVANDINRFGEVVGYALTPNGTSYGYAYQNGTKSPLYPAPGYQNAYAVGVNDVGQVVGASYNFFLPEPQPLSDVCDAATLWEGQSATDLNTLLPAGNTVYLYNAEGIANTGNIVADGYGPDMALHAYLLVPSSSVAARGYDFPRPECAAGAPARGTAGQTNPSGQSAEQP